MAVTESTNNLVFNREEAKEILAKAQEQSFVMQLGKEVALPGSGIDYQIVTDGEASFVAEMGSKPVVDPTLGKKTMIPHKIAIIEVVSDELMEDRNALVQHLIDRLPGQFAAGFDKEVVKTGSQASPLANFGYLGAASAVSCNSSMYDGLVNAEYAVNSNLYQVTNILFSSKAKKALRDAKDENNRPIFDNYNLQDGKVASMALGYPIVFNEHCYTAGAAGTPGTPETYGFLGDWSKLLYGIRDGLKIDFSKQASVTTSGGTTINCFQQNMTAIRAEMRVGTLIQDINAFARLTGATPTTVANKKGKK